MSEALGSLAIDAGDLELGGGLLALLRPALAHLVPGGVLAVRSRSAGARDDLPAWCRLAGHRYLGCEAGEDGADRHLVARGADAVARAPLQGGRADPRTGFAPPGARVEPGGPAYPFDLVEGERVAPPEVAELHAQAIAAQWSADRDVPWDTVRRLSPAIDEALAQILSFLAENELAALYVPARFLPRLHPAFLDVAQFLATQLADEARHVDVFLRRARACGGPPPLSAVTTARSLHALLTLDDFTEAAFLLSVLGEGTFLDLLRFVETHAPDEATAVLVRRARADEARHVHFGMAHVRHALAHDAGLFLRLEAAVRRRAVALHDAGGPPAALLDALTLLAAGDIAPGAVARGHEALRGLLETMHASRMRRLQQAGFTAEQAERISTLHTPNFM